MNSKEKAYIAMEMKELEDRRRAYKDVDVTIQAAFELFNKASKSIPPGARRLDSLSNQVSRLMGRMTGMASYCAVYGDAHQRAVLASLEDFQRKLKARDAKSSSDRFRDGVCLPRNAKPSLLVPTGKYHSSRKPTKRTGADQAGHSTGLRAGGAS